MICTASVLPRWGSGLTPSKAALYVTEAPGAAAGLSRRPAVLSGRAGRCVRRRGGYYYARRITFCTSVGGHVNRPTDCSRAGRSPISSLLDNRDLSPGRIGSSWPRTPATEAGFYEARCTSAEFKCPWMSQMDMICPQFSVHTLNEMICIPPS